MMSLIYLLFHSSILIFSLYLQVKQLNEYKSFFNLELILLALGTGFWMIIGEINLIWPSINYDIEKILGDLGFIIIIGVYLRLSYIFSKFVFSKMLKFSTQTAIIGLSMLIGLRLGNLLLGESLLFAGPRMPVIFPVISIFILIGHLSASVIFLQANYFFYRRMNDTIDEILEKVTNLTVVFVILSIGLVLIYSISSYVNPGFGINFLPVLRLGVGTSTLSIVYYIGNNPTILLTNKVNIDSLIDNGYIGYSLVSVKDQGPTSLATSETFNQKYEISQTNEMLFASTKITVIGIGDSFKNTIFSIPYPQKENLNTISISFLFKDSELKDKRMKKMGNAIFSILIPNNLSPLISVNFDVFPRFVKFISDKNELNEFIDDTFLKLLTKELIQNML